MLACERGKVGQVYILSGPRPITVRELLAAACTALGKVPLGRAYVPTGLATLLAGCAEFAWSANGRRPPITRDAVATLTVDRALATAGRAWSWATSPACSMTKVWAKL